LETIKPYDPELDQVHGKPAELAVHRHLVRQPWVDRVEMFPFGEQDVDLRYRFWQTGMWMYVDVEKRTRWTEGAFPWKLANVPHRKRDMIEKYRPFEMWILREDLREAIVIAGAVLRGSKVSKVRNYMVGSGERFYRVRSWREMRLSI